MPSCSQNFGGGWGDGQLLSLPVPGCVPGSHHSRPWVIGHMRTSDRFFWPARSFSITETFAEA